MPDTTQHVQLAVKASPDELWHALTDPSVTPAYYYGFAAHFDLEPGRPYRYTAGGADVITGTVLDVEPGRRLQTTFAGHWTPDVDALPESRVTITLSDPPMQQAGVTVLSLRHEGLPDVPAAAQLELGWVMILSGLKTLVETRAPLAA